MYTKAVKNYKDMYEEECKESRKERTESHLEYPQVMAQSYKGIRKKFLHLWIRTLQILESTTILLTP